MIPQIRMIFAKYWNFFHGSHITRTWWKYLRNYAFKYSKINDKNEYWPFVGVQARLSLFFSILNEMLSTLTSLLLENFIWIVTTHRGVQLPDAFTELLNAISSINSVSQSKIHSTNKPMTIVTSNRDPDHLSCFYCRLHPLFHCLLANGTFVHSIIGNTSHASLMTLVLTNDTFEAAWAFSGAQIILDFEPLCWS